VIALILMRFERWRPTRCAASASDTGMPHCVAQSAWLTHGCAVAHLISAPLSSLSFHLPCCWAAAHSIVLSSAREASYRRDSTCRRSGRPPGRLQGMIDSAFSFLSILLSRQAASGKFFGITSGDVHRFDRTARLFLSDRCGAHCDRGGNDWRIRRQMGKAITTASSWTIFLARAMSQSSLLVNTP
jgi:hypothetical protein